MLHRLSQRELGESLGISQAAVSKLMKRGMPGDSFEAAQAWREQRQNIAMRAAPPEPIVPRGTHKRLSYPQGDGIDESEESIDEARTRLMSAQADNEELKRAQTERELLNRERIERAVFEAARGLRDQLSSCAGTLGALVAGLTSAQECEEEIRREHRHLLDTFVRELAQKIEAV
jgi:transcriptional regulator with XRE-family HTH domain